MSKINRSFIGQRALTVKNVIYTILCRELGLGRQPRVADLLADELFTAVDACYQSADTLRVGQCLLILPRRAGRRRREDTMADIPKVAVRLTLVCEQDVEAMIAGEPPAELRMRKIRRMIQEAYDQGAALSLAQLSLLTGMGNSNLAHLVRTHQTETGELLPLRGAVEHMGPAVSHKAEIIRCHLKGMSTAEISLATNHSPRSVERYIKRFNQLRELAPFLGTPIDVVVAARILGLGVGLAQAYLDLMPQRCVGGEPPAND